MLAKGTLKVAEWNEVAVKGDVFRVSAEFSLADGIVGRMGVEYMMYTIKQAADQHDSETAYRGFLLFEGSIEGKAGAFALADAGLYTEKGPESRFLVVEGSGRGGFAGVTGYGKYFPKENVIAIEMALEFEGMF